MPPLSIRMIELFPQDFGYDRWLGFTISWLFLNDWVINQK